MSAATDWANKKKAAMEHAKKLREDRKNGMGDNLDGATFKPQINARPAYLNNAKDTLDMEVKIQTNDVFEQPLPGAKGKQQYQEFNSGLPSPGSDALGKEMKNYSVYSNNSKQAPQMPNAAMTDAQYKSAFLQQYETEKQLKNMNRLNTNSAQYSDQAQAVEDDFAKMLRSDSNTSGQGWNNDTSSDGFVARKSNIPSNRVVKKQAPPPPQQSSGFNDYQSPDRYNNPPAPRASAMQQPSRRTQPAVQQQEWNMDSEYVPALLPPKVSPRGVQQSSCGSATKISPRGSAVGSSSTVQHSKLSLLKSKIRDSASGGSSRVSNSNAYDTQQQQAQHSSGMMKSNSGIDRYQQGDDFGDYNANNSNSGGGRKTAPVSSSSNYDFQQEPPIAAAPRAGRRGPPASTQQASSVSSKQQQQADAFKREQEEYLRQQQQQQQSDDFSYQPSFKANGNNGTSRQPPLRSNSGQQYNSRFDDNDEPEPVNNVQQQSRARNVPVNKPSAQSQPPQRQQQHQQQPPPQQPQQQRSAPPQSASYSTNTMSEYPPDDDEDAGQAGNQPQYECPDCGRKFNLIPYEKHVKICAKVFLQKRKAFDSTKMRVNDNPELVQILNKVKKEEKKKAIQQQKAPEAYRNPENKPVAAAAADDGKAKWKEQSNAFREAMKAARMYKQAIAKGEAPPPVVASGPDMSLIPCNNCGRRFNEKAAERHIPLCKNIIAKPSSLKRGAGGGGGVNGAPSVAAKGGATKGKIR